MELKKDRAIILRTIRYQDRDQIVTALSENQGHLTALAKNSVHSRRFGSGLEHFTAGEWIYTIRPGVEVVSLREVQVRRDFSGIRRDLNRIALAGVMSEILSKTAQPETPCPDLFKLYFNALALLDEAQNTPEPSFFIAAFIARILFWSGALPRLQSCLGCQRSLEQAAARQEMLIAAVAEAGWFCPSCANTHASGDSQMQISSLALHALWESLRFPIRSIQLILDSGTMTQDISLFTFWHRMLAFHIPGIGEQPFKSLKLISF